MQRVVSRDLSDASYPLKQFREAISWTLPKPAPFGQSCGFLRNHMDRDLGNDVTSAKNVYFGVCGPRDYLIIPSWNPRYDLRPNTGLLNQMHIKKQNRRINPLRFLFD